MLKFHATGDWPEGAVHIRRAESTRAAVPEVEAAIEQSWHEARSRRPGANLFDGELCRLESFAATIDSLELVLSRTTYKAFFGTNICNPQLAERFGTQVLANPIGISCALVTCDDFFILGRRNSSVAHYPNRLHPFAGMLEQRESPQVFDEVRRELREEVSLLPGQLTDLRCIGIVEDSSIRQPELIFSARTTRLRSEVEAHVDAKEHGSAWATPATEDSLRAAIANPLEFTPVAVASMILWARARGWRITESEAR